MWGMLPAGLDQGSHGYEPAQRAEIKGFCHEVSYLLVLLPVPVR